MAQIPEHIKKSLSPAQLQALEAEQGGMSQPPLSYEEWLAQNPQYMSQQQPQKNKNPWMEIAKDTAKGYVKGKIKEAAQGSQTPATMTGSGTAFSSGAIYEGQPIGTAADGGTMMSTGQVIPAAEGSPVGPAGAGEGSASTMTGAGQAAQGALGAYQAYDGYNQFKEGDKVGGGLTMAQGANNMYGAANGVSGGAMGGNAGAYLAAAKGAYNMYNASQGLGTGEQKAQNMTKAAATAVADYYTFGGASLAKKAFGKEVKKIDNFVDPIMTKYDPGTRTVGKILGESTRKSSKRHTQELFAKSEDPNYQAYVAGMREQFQGGPPDPNNPFGDTKGNKYKTWDDYVKGGLDAANLTGVMGNIETFGPAWSNLSFDQQQAVTQALIDDNQYESKRGEVLVKDQNKARQTFDNVVKGSFQIPTAEKPKLVAPAQSAPGVSSPSVPVVPYPATPPPGTTYNSAMNAINTGFKIPVAPPTTYQPKGVAPLPQQQAPLTQTPPAPTATLTPVQRLMIPRASGSMAGGLTR